ncbi:cytochrome c biogenesis protein ResB [Candidatus Pandoraea novymonadis]|nr:cytochrome c biogenesis protein ResB [Candidatus Pandoraea novymonadis]
MRFAISLLMVLAIVSSIGTIIKQNEPYTNYVNKFGPFWAENFRVLGLFSVYSSGWFLAILGFLMISTVLCVFRNAPKIIADIRNWRDDICEGSLRSFDFQAEFISFVPRSEILTRVRKYIERRGYRSLVRERDGATFLAAKIGTVNKIGYLFIHIAIVIIFFGGVLDSDLLIRAQIFLFDKTLIQDNQVIPEISKNHRLSSENPTFRGHAFIPEGGHSSTAILNFHDGALIQELPFSIELKKFHVDYYSTGVPKLFSSDIVLANSLDGKSLHATIKVNEPFHYKGVTIYQSSFEDGGSKLRLIGYPMTGPKHTSFDVLGEVGDTIKLTNMLSAKRNALDYSIELSDFRSFNVESVPNASEGRAAPSVKKHSLRADLSQYFGSGAPSFLYKDFRNVGPSVQYKIRDRTGQEREYHNYMSPILLEDGQYVFMSGVRDVPDARFQYLRIPADAEMSVKQWMLLRAALSDEKARTEAVRRFVLESLPAAGSEQNFHAELLQSAKRELDLFAGAVAAVEGRQPAGGLQAITDFITTYVPITQQASAAHIFHRILYSTVWHLWQVAREGEGLPLAQLSPDNSRFIHVAINALSDHFLYAAPVFLQLNSFDQIQASVFQLTRSPGKKIVYFGGFLLVLGIFSMFYIRERRLWLLVKVRKHGGSSVLMASSTTRHALDFNREFERMKEEIAVLVETK